MFEEFSEAIKDVQIKYFENDFERIKDVKLVYDNDRSITLTIDHAFIKTCWIEQLDNFNNFNNFNNLIGKNIKSIKQIKDEVNCKKEAVYGVKEFYEIKFRNSEEKFNFQMINKEFCFNALIISELVGPKN